MHCGLFDRLAVEKATRVSKYWGIRYNDRLVAKVIKDLSFFVCPDQSWQFNINITSESSYNNWQSSKKQQKKWGENKRVWTIDLLNGFKTNITFVCAVTID
jgi:hypothetical protein